MGAVLGSVAVGCGAVLCRFEVGDCNQNQNGQQNEGVALGQGGKAEKNSAQNGVEGRKADEMG